MNKIIEYHVEIGKNVKLGNFIVLKNGTKIGNNVTLGDYVCTTGICYIGNGVNIRTKSCISKGVIVEDKAFVGGAVMTSHTKHVYFHKPKMDKKQHITRIGYGAVIGSGVNMRAGVSVGDNTIVGYGSNVINDLPANKICFGNPARPIKNTPKKWITEKPDNYKEYNFPINKLSKYLPHYSRD